MAKNRPASISLSHDVLMWLIGRGSSQAEVARMLGVSEGYISLVKSRERALTVDHLAALADCLKLPLGAMLLQVSPPPNKNMTPETAELLDVTERLIHQADKAAASMREHLEVAGKKR